MVRTLGKARWTRLWKGWIRPLVLFAILFGSVRSAIGEIVYVPTGSMRPTVLEGDRLLVNKAAFDLRIPLTDVRLVSWGDPRRGSIVLFRSPEDGRRVLKRVVGVPGDTIEMRENRLVVNGEPAAYRAEDGGDDAEGFRVLVESLAGSEHRIRTADRGGPLATFGPVTVPEGRYLVLGDNRDDSYDGRAWGFLDRNRILGRIEGIVYSLDPDRIYLPRTDRLLRGIR